jgi:hypothetical protein
LVFLVGDLHFEISVGAVKEKQTGEYDFPHFLRLDKNDVVAQVKPFVGPLHPPALLRRWDVKLQRNFDLSKGKINEWQVTTYLRTPTVEESVYKITM